MTASGTEQHVVAALLRRNGRVLLCHRAPGRAWYPDTWDLPGGHVEAGELPREALRRELAEELGVGIAPPAEPMARVPGNDYRLDVFLIDEWSGEPANIEPAEHDALGWFDVAQARRLTLADQRLLDLVAVALDGC
ncbi:MAG: NUDIX domain-containing protein [Actinomycetota bacterium]|nr:NUDIX domain-containing protein [Actinomycetota bacterium]